MSKRDQAREQTRARIVEATAKLHAEHGVLGTTWKDIAAAADVSVATVYAHFSSLDELLPACGALVMEWVKPPGLDSASEVVAGAERLGDRFERIADELHRFYARGGPYIEVDVRERQLPGMQEWERYMLDTVTAFVDAALAGRRVSVQTLGVLRALFDLPTFKALEQRGVTPKASARSVAGLATSLVEAKTTAKRILSKQTNRPATVASTEETQ